MSSGLLEMIGEVFAEALSQVVAWRARRGRRIWPIFAGIALVVAAAVLFVVYG